jgi:hypothetical protein
MAARKASEIVSRLTATASGPGWPAAISSSSESGYGCIHGIAAIDGPVRADTVLADMVLADMVPAGALDGAGTARRASRRSVSRQALVATRYSQVRGLDRPWKLSRERHARRSTSCT